MFTEWIATLTTGTDDAVSVINVNAQKITNMSEQKHIFYLLPSIHKNVMWKVFLELIMHNITTMTATPDEIVSKLLANKAALKRERGLTPEAQLLAKKVGNDCNDDNCGKGPNRDMRDNKDKRTENDQ